MALINNQDIQIVSLIFVLSGVGHFSFNLKGLKGWAFENWKLILEEYGGKNLIPITRFPHYVNIYMAD